MLLQGFAAVETNFRMYSYSTSKLNREILRLLSMVNYCISYNIVKILVNKYTRVVLAQVSNPTRRVNKSSIYNITMVLYFYVT